MLFQELCFILFVSWIPLVVANSCNADSHVDLTGVTRAGSSACASTFESNPASLCTADSTTGQTLEIPRCATSCDTTTLSTVSCVSHCATGFVCCVSAGNACLPVGEECPCPDCADTIPAESSCSTGASFLITKGGGSINCCTKAPPSPPPSAFPSPPPSASPSTPPPPPSPSPPPPSASPSTPSSSPSPPPSSSPSPPRPLFTGLQAYPDTLKLETNGDCKTARFWISDPVIVPPSAVDRFVRLTFQSTHFTFTPSVVQWDAQPIDSWKQFYDVNVCTLQGQTQAGGVFTDLVTLRSDSELYAGLIPNFNIQIAGTPSPPPSATPTPPPSASPSPPTPTLPPSNTWIHAASLADTSKMTLLQIDANFLQTIDFSDSSSILKQNDYIYFERRLGPTAQIICLPTTEGPNGNFLTQRLTIQITLVPGYYFCCLIQNGLTYPHVHTSLHATAIAPSSPPAPPPTVCVNGMEWTENAHPVDATCLHPTQPPSTHLVDRCACVEGMYMQDGGCVEPNDCDIFSPSPPPPRAPPPHPPTPPLIPNSYSPSASSPCTAQQDIQNKNYCYDRLFSSSMCELDERVRCPEKCGRCNRIFLTDTATNSYVKIEFVFSTPIEKFDRPVFRQRFASSLEISEFSIDERIAQGSSKVNVDIFSIDGSAFAAASIGNKFNEIFTKLSDTDDILGHEATEMSIELMIPEPSPPPPPRSPPRSPPLVPPTTPPLSPPLSPPLPPLPTLPPGTEDDDSNTGAVVGAVAGSIVFVVFVTIVAHCATTRKGGGENAKTAATAESKPLVVTAARPFSFSL